MPDKLTNVWELETLDEQRANDDLLGIAYCAFAGQPWAVAYLTDLWDGENWDSIKIKLETERSVWYVWWRDGVRKHLAQSRKRVGRDLTEPLT